MSATVECSGCGEDFTVDIDEDEISLQEYFANEPVWCEDCQMQSAFMHYDEFSDADPGL